MSISQLEISKWGKLYRFISNLKIGSSHHLNEQQRVYINESISRFLGKENLLNLWKEILNMKKEDINQIKSDTILLINGTRIISVLKKFKLFNDFSYPMFSFHLVSILINYSAGLDKNSSQFSNFVMILEMIPPSSSLNVIKSIIDTESLIFVNNIVDNVEIEWVLKAFKLMIKLYNEDKKVYRGKSFPFEMLGQLGKKLSVNNFHEELVDIIATARYDISELIPNLLIGASFSLDIKWKLLDYSAFLWSDIQIISTGNIVRSNNLTNCLMELLAKSNKEDLDYRSQLDHSSISIKISHGISNYFDQNQREYQQFGMKVASRFAQIIGYELKFDDLLVSNDNENSSETKNKTMQTHDTLHDQSERNIHRIDSSDSDDSEDTEDSDTSEITPLEQASGDVDYLDRKYHTSFLSDCLEFLRSQETSPETRKLHLAALQRVPLIMQRCPPEGSSLSIPLLKQIISLDNSFNIEDFDRLKCEAIVAIVSYSPESCLPLITQMLFSEEVSIGTKCEALVWITRSGISLSNISVDEFSSIQLNPELKAPAGILEDNKATELKDLVGNSTIFRPNKLKQLGKTKIYSRNRFLKYTNIYINPIFRYLRGLFSTRDQSIDPNRNLLLHIHGNSSSSLGEDLPTVLSNDISSKLEGVTGMAPMQALLSLATLMKCNRHHLEEMRYALESIQLSLWFFKEGHPQSIRRASLVCILTSIQILFQRIRDSQSSPQTPRAYTPKSAIEHLSNIIVEDTTSSSYDVEFQKVELLNNQVIAGALETIVNRLNSEPDESNRLLMKEILKTSIQDFL